jgi:tetratricopeptide (TPR) repeat protein
VLQRARNAREHDRNEEAIQAFRLVISRMGGYFLPANLELAYTLISLKRNDEAMASLQAVADRDGSYFPIAYFHLGRLHEFKGELELAERNYEQVISVYGQNNPQFLLELSRVREKMGNFEGALTSMEAYVKEMERLGQKPDWTDARAAYLRKRSADSKAAAKQ